MYFMIRPWVRERRVSLAHGPMRVVWSMVLCSLLGACAAQQRQTQELPPRPILAGTAGFLDTSGELVVLLERDQGCIKSIAETTCEQTKSDGECLQSSRTLRTVNVPACGQSIDALDLLTPWGAVLTSQVDTAGVASFAIDWNSVPIDPMTEHARVLLSGPWQIRAANAANPLSWKPSSANIERMLTAIGYARELDTSVEPWSRPVRLSVRQLDIDGDVLVAGKPTRVHLTVQNHGSGPAFRVIGRTRSSDPRLHGRQISFGRIDAGQSMTRSLVIGVPEGGNEPSAMMVVFVSGANAGEVQHSRRIAITQPPEPQLGPVLSLACELDAQSSQRAPLVQPGRSMDIQCELRNQGRATVEAVDITAQAMDQKMTQAIAGSIASGASTSVRLRLPVPPEAPTRTPLTIAIMARSGKHTAATSLAVQTTKTQVCPEGTLSWARYREKRAELQQALEHNALDRREYDHYDAELIGCIE